jgi:hypothetical protein
MVGGSSPFGGTAGDETGYTEWLVPKTSSPSLASRLIVLRTDSVASCPSAPIFFAITFGLTGR